MEIAVNNRPLSYVEDDVQLPVLTPNLIMYGQSNLLPEADVDSIEETDLRKRARYLRRCKDLLSYCDQVGPTSMEKSKRKT